MDGKNDKQECIPVGCVPPAAVAVSPAMHTPCHTCPHLTDRCKHISGGYNIKSRNQKK